MAITLEKLLSQVLGSADGSQCRVQDGDPVAESLGLLEPVGGEKDWRISTPFSALSRTPATVAEPEVGAIKVPRVRTMVVLPAPLGPRNPNTSP
jgi:hypothetical protein